MSERNMNKKTGKGLSIRGKWIIFICLSMLLAIGVTCIFNYITIRNILEDDNNTVGKTNAQNTAQLVNLNLKNYQTSIDQLANLVSTEIQSGDTIQRIEKLIGNFQKENNTLIAAYYMDFTTGKLHISPSANIDLDVRETRTYKQLSENTKTQWMDVYEDKDQRKIMTSIVSPVIANGNMVGAVGYDIDLSTIGTEREKIETTSNTKLVILDAQGFIVSSFMKDSDGKNMNPAKSGEVEGVEDLISNGEKFNTTFGWVEKIYGNSKNYTHGLIWDGKGYSGEITTIPELNWKVLSFTPDEFFADKMGKFNRTAIISILLGLLIGVISAIFLAEMLKRIITNFQRVIGKTAKGDLVSEIVTNSNDEIGNLSKTYNEMLSNMRNLINKVLGNVDSIKQSTSGLTVIASEHSIAITEVSRAVEEIAKGAGNHTEEIVKGSRAVSDLGSEIEELSKQSTIIEQEVDEASTRIIAGNQQVENLEMSYQNLENAFGRVTEMISKLDEKSKSISNVTNAIAQIAEQTNLLSLNASIEAARAGEHGRGFSVVANEVRNLAEESKKATEDIQNIINSVLSDTHELVGVMGKTNQISAEQKGAVTQVSTSINQITDSLNKIMLSVKEEATSINSIQEQKDVVVGMIEELSSVSQETSAASEEIAAAMEEQAASTNVVAQHASQLSNLVEELNKAVGEFHIKK